MASAKVQPHESSLYYELSHFYDLIFRRVFYPRIAKVVRSLNIEPAPACSRSVSAPGFRSTRTRSTAR